MSEQPATSQRVTAAEAAAILGVSTTTIRRMVKRGELEGERVHRPQGTAFVVTLPDHATHAAEDAAPTQQVAGAPPRSNASPAGQLAAWSETFLVPLVAALERSQATVRDQAETIGRQAAELDGARAQISALEARTAAQPVNPPPRVILSPLANVDAVGVEGAGDRRRGRAAGAAAVRPRRAAVIALVAAIAVAICVLTITWAAADLLRAFARYWGLP